MTRSLSLVVGILLLGAAIAYPVVRRDTLVPTSSGMLVNGPLVVTGEVEFDSGQSLGTGTVTSTEILDNTITTDDIGTDGVAADEIAADAVGASEIAAGAVATSELATGAVGNVDMGATMMDKIILCGQLVNNNTVYVGPATTVYLAAASAEAAIGGTTCDGLDSGTEATADAPIATNFPAFKVHGLYCRISSDPTNDVVITARSAAADMTPSLTCTIAGTGSATHCRALTSTTTDIAAGATIAVKAVTTEDLSAQDIWCELYFSIS